MIFRDLSYYIKSCFLVCLDVFGLCCIFQVHNTRIHLKVEQDKPFQGSWPACLVHTKVRTAAFTLIQMNGTNKEIALKFVFIEHCHAKCEHTLKIL